MASHGLAMMICLLAGHKIFVFAIFYSILFISYYVFVFFNGLFKGLTRIYHRPFKDYLHVFSKLLVAATPRFAGWASKVVADHLHMGVKSGQPYVRHNKASNPFTNLKKEWKGLWWQESIIKFLQSIRLSSSSRTATDAYVDLAGQLDQRFSSMHPYFKRLTDAMRTWTRIWKRAEQGHITFAAKQRNISLLKPINLASRSINVSKGDINPAVPVPVTSGKLIQDLRALRTDPKRGLICKEDRTLGKLWKTYVYPLPSEFNVDPLRELIQKDKCIISGCPSSPEKLSEYNAEAIILLKLLEAIDITDNPLEADLILVPALSAVYVPVSYGKCFDMF